MSERTIKLVELPPPFQIKETRVEGIQQFGKDNAYPTRIERLINRSITARSAAQMLTRFLIGNGFKDETLNSLVVGTDNYYKNITALDLLRHMAGSVAYNHGLYVRIQYNMNHEITGLKSEVFKNCRFGKLDTQEYTGKIVIYDNWDRQKATRVIKKDFILVDIYNPRKAVIEKQIGENIKKYNGQIYFRFFDDSYLYPVSLIDPVQYEADTERQIQMFKNGELRRGFFMKQIIHHTQFSGKKAAEDFTEKIKNFIGGGHENSALVVEGTFDTEGKLLQNQNIAIEKIEQNVTDKLFDSYEGSTANAIRKAYYAIPQILIEYEDSKLGTTSGEALRQAADFYNQMTKDLRKELSGIFKELFANWHDVNYKEKDFEILPLEFGEKEEPGQIDTAFARLFHKLGFNK